MTDTALLTGQDIGEAEGAMTALLERAIAPTGRSRAEYITLRVLAAQSPHGSDAELIDFLASQRQLGLAPADVVTMLDRLRADGLMTASPVELTAAGHNLLQELARRPRCLGSRFLSGPCRVYIPEEFSAWRG